MCMGPLMMKSFLRSTGLSAILANPYHWQQYATWDVRGTVLTCYSNTERWQLLVKS